MTDYFNLEFIELIFYIYCFFMRFDDFYVIFLFKYVIMLVILL